MNWSIHQFAVTRYFSVGCSVAHMEFFYFIIKCTYVFSYDLVGFNFLPLRKSAKVKGIVCCWISKSNRNWYFTKKSYKLLAHAKMFGFNHFGIFDYIGKIHWNWSSFFIIMNVSSSSQRSVLMFRVSLHFVSSQRLLGRSSSQFA